MNTHHDRHSSKSSLTSMMMMSNSSCEKIFMLSDMDFAEHLEQDEQQLLRSKLFSSSVSSSLFSRMIDELEHSSKSDIDSGGKDQDSVAVKKGKKTEKNYKKVISNKYSSDQTSSLLLSTQIESCTSLPEHEFDSCLMSMMSSFQKTMSISSHSDEDELTKTDKVCFHLLEQIDCDPKPVQDQAQQHGKRTGPKGASKPSFISPIPSFKLQRKTNNTNKGNKDTQENNFSGMTNQTLSLASSVSYIAPNLVTPISSTTSKPAVEIINLEEIAPSVPSPGCYYVDPDDTNNDGDIYAPSLLHYHAAPPMTVTTGTSSTDNFHDSLTTQGDEDGMYMRMPPIGMVGPPSPPPPAMVTPTSSTHYQFQCLSPSSPSGAHNMVEYHQPPRMMPDPQLIETEYMRAVERLQLSMERSRVSRVAVTRQGSTSPKNCCASANSGALLRQQHARYNSLPVHEPQGPSLIMTSLHAGQQQQPPPPAAVGAFTFIV